MPEQIFIGRVCVPGSPREHAVRVRTDGAAPTPDDLVEEIDDPFFAASAWRTGTHGDAFVLARAAEPLPGGLRGRVGDYVVAAPVVPGKIVCIGRNYRAHAEEMGNAVPDEPILFYKPSSARLGSGRPLALPGGYERIDMESELVAVIGRRTRRVAAARALEHVAGYTLGNDVSCRDLQQRDKQWTRAKGIDGFAPCGPFVRLFDPGAVLPGDARIQGRYDGELKQDGRLDAMIFDVPHLLEYVSAVMTLEPGDLVFTGTPAGVTALVPGGTVVIELHGVDLGRLETPLVADDSPGI